MTADLQGSVRNWQILAACLSLLGAGCASETSDGSVDTGSMASNSAGVGPAAAGPGVGPITPNPSGSSMGPSVGPGAPSTTAPNNTASPTSPATQSMAPVGPPTPPFPSAQPTGDPSGGAGGDTSREGTCVPGINTGSTCQPAVDTATCQVGGLDCSCGATGQWSCSPVSAGGNGGMPPMSGGAGGNGGNGGGVAPAEMEWLPSWATTIQRTEDSNEPPPLGGTTLRQFVWPSYSGNEIRIQLSNERGNGPVEITKVHIAHAQPLGQGQIDAATDAEFTFNGNAAVTIPQGETAWSDALTFELDEMEPMAVTMHFNVAPSDVTGHPGARTTSYIANGDVVSEANLAGAETRDRWYYINAIEVMAPADAYAIAVLGDSITDGYGVLNQFARWPDFLNIAINEDAMIADDVSVLNFGMGANNLTVGNADMDPGIERFERDVLGRQEKIRWLIVLIGVNDMIYSNVSADQIIAAYEEIIDRSHDAGILVYGSPITPFASHTQGNPLNVRSEVNTWITTSGAFDEVIDLAGAVADPGNPEQLSQPLSNDGLHPNTAGYEAMGNAVDLSLFYNNTLP